MIESSAVVLQGVKKAFRLGAGAPLTVLDVDHFALAAGTSTVLRGRSGSGKTTLLNLVAGISLPTAGTIAVRGTDIATLAEPHRDRFRAQHIGYVFQTFNLLAPFSAVENVMLAMMFATAIPRRAQRRRAVEILTRLGLGMRLAHKPAQLSRGEQQRVALARALANDPPLVLADEPCASLDPATARDVLGEFVGVCRADGKTVLIVAHDDVVLETTDRVVDMRELNRAG